MKTHFLILALVFALPLGWLGAQSSLMAQAEVIEPIDEARALLEDERNTVEVVERYGASVVAVNIYMLGQRLDPFEGLPEEFRRFFDFFQPQMPGQQPEQQRMGSGSGFVVNEEGHIVTNYHVVRGALQPNQIELLEGAALTVIFPDRPEDELAARVLGANPNYDLALLELVNPEDLPDVPPIPLADSDEVRTGQKAIAIGNPFGLRSTVTSGIVSTVAREEIPGAEFPIPMIQTDAAINRGNSGGPLLNSRGELIGINTAILAGLGGGFVGVGFAVPSNFLAEDLPILAEGGPVGLAATRPRIGVSIDDVANYPEAVRRQLRLPETGVMVVAVQPGSPAERAGLRGAQFRIDVGNEVFPAGGDIITAIDGQAVESASEVQTIVFAREEGDTVTLTIIRDGEETTVEVTLEVVPPTN
jgi:serine protease Do